MRRYYNRELDEAARVRLDWDNWLVLAASQAASGTITRNMIALVVHPGAVDQSVNVEFVLFVAPWSADNDAMMEFAEDLDVLLEGHVEIQTTVTVDRDWRFDRFGRLLYLVRRNRLPAGTESGDVVLVAGGGSSARFHSRTAPRNSYPYEGSDFVVEIEAPGVSVKRSVFVYGFSWAELTDYFKDLSESWRGWEGTKEWSSPEYDLTIQAKSGPLGHCFLTFLLREGPDPSWKAAFGEFVVPLGEDMSTLAKRVAEWTSG